MSSCQKVCFSCGLCIGLQTSDEVQDLVCVCVRGKFLLQTVAIGHLNLYSIIIMSLDNLDLFSSFCSKEKSTYFIFPCHLWMCI